MAKRDPAPTLAIALSGTSCEAALVSLDGGPTVTAAATAETSVDALKKALATLARSASLPAAAVVASDRVHGLCLVLPEQALDVQRWTKLLRWETEPLLASVREESAGETADGELCFGWSEGSGDAGKGHRLVAVVTRTDLDALTRSLRENGLRLGALYPLVGAAAAAWGGADGALAVADGDTIDLTLLREGRVVLARRTPWEGPTRAGLEARQAGFTELVCAGSQRERLLRECAPDIHSVPAPESPVAPVLLGLARHEAGATRLSLPKVRLARPRTSWRPRAEQLVVALGLLLLLLYIPYRIDLADQLRGVEPGAQASPGQEQSRQERARTEQLQREIAALQQRLGPVADLPRRARLVRHVFVALSEALRSSRVQLASVEETDDAVRIEGEGARASAVHQFAAELQRRLEGWERRVSTPALERDTERGIFAFSLEIRAAGGAR